MGVPALVSPGAKAKSGWANDVVSQLVPTAWVAPTLAGTWVNFGGANQVAQYRMLGDIVYIRGLIKLGTINTVAFTLPVGLRPPGDLAIAVVSNALFGVLIITAATGVVTPAVGSNISFWLGCQFSTLA